MKKIFISQPMKNRSEEQIKKERQAIINAVKKWLNEEIEVIDTFFTDEAPALIHLGRSIQLLQQADYAIFADDWQYARGCRVERLCCASYDVPFFDRQEIENK